MTTSNQDSGRQLATTILCIIVFLHYDCQLVASSQGCFPDSYRKNKQANKQTKTSKQTKNKPTNKWLSTGNLGQIFKQLVYYTFLKGI